VAHRNGGIDLTTINWEFTIMVATPRIQFPDDMTQAVQSQDAPTLETFATDILERVKDYARDEPVKFALWSFGIGFVLGWRLKPW
jgi:hypothetical protein